MREDICYARDQVVKSEWLFYLVGGGLIFQNIVFSAFEMLKHSFVG